MALETVVIPHVEYEAFKDIKQAPNVPRRFSTSRSNSAL